MELPHWKLPPLAMPPVSRRARKAAIATALIIFGCLLAYFTFGGAVFVITIFFLIGAGSMYYKRHRKGLPIGIELITILTFVIGISYGAVVGVFFGLVTGIVGQYVVGRDFDGDSILFVIAVGIIGAFSSQASQPLMFWVGVSSLFSSIMSQFIDIIGRPEQKAVAIIYIITHFAITLALWNPISLILPLL